MPKYSRRPSDPIEAMQFEGKMTVELAGFLGDCTETLPPENGKHSWDEPSMTLRLWNSEEHQHIKVPSGHWIAIGGAGEYYPISEERFNALYEPVRGMDVAEAEVISGG